MSETTTKPASKPRRQQFIDKPPPMQTVDVKFPPKFADFLASTTFFDDVDPLTLPKWLACYGGRGSGKTTSIAMALVLMGRKMPLRILCAREIMNSLKQSSHDALRKAIFRLNLTDWFDIKDEYIKGQWVDWINPATGVLEKRRTEILFTGLRSSATGNVSSLEAIKSYNDIQIVWIDEAAPISQTSWDYLSPTIRRTADSDSSMPCQIWVSWNPRNEFDLVHQMFVVAPPPEHLATIVRMDYWDNPWFDASGLTQEMELMKQRDYEKYLHIWEGHLKKYYEGMVYRSEMEAADQDGRICDLPYRADAGFVQAYFDIGGGSDKTAVWVAQKVGEFIHVLAYHEAVQSSTDYWLNWLESQPYTVTKIFLPHDARQIHAGAANSYEQLIRNKNKNVGIVPSRAGAREEGINALRVLFPTLKFDRVKCANGLQCLRNYRYQLVDDDNIENGFKQVPVHDRFSHGADAGRYMAMALRLADPMQIKPGFYNAPGTFSGPSTWMSL